jgi:hypothetical protein
MARLTRKRMYKKKSKGGAIGQFFDEIGSSFKGLVSRTRKKSAELIDKGSSAVSSAVKGTEGAVSSGINRTETTLSNVGKNVSNTTKQMMGGKKRRMRKSRKSRKSRKLMGGKKRRMHKSRKSRK